MPTPRTNVIKKNLTKDEKESFAAFGRTEEQIKDIEQRLRAPNWTFWAKAAELYITLKVGASIIYEGGKQKTVDECMGAKFTNNYFNTNSRELALNIFLSDLYFDGNIKESDDQVKDEAKKKYNEFKLAVMSDPGNRERLKEDFKEEFAQSEA